MAELSASYVYLMEKNEAISGNTTKEFEPFTDEEMEVFEELRRNRK